MNSEIKLLRNDVDTALANLQSSTNTLKAILPLSIGKNNVLDVVDKLEQLNKELTLITESYKSLLLQNEESTRLSVTFMSGVDTELSSLLRTK